MWLLRVIPIILLSIVASIVYGIIHDEITARVCLEYFTIGHPPVFNIHDPTLLGLGWGVIASWWVGLILGVPLAIAATVGRRPVIGVYQIYRPLALTLLIVGATAAVAGFMGHFAAQRGWVFLVSPMAEEVPGNRQVAFLTDLWMHLASYIAGALGGIGLSVWTWKSRLKLCEESTAASCV